MFAGMAVLAFAVLLIGAIVGRVERRLLSWKPPQESESVSPRLWRERMSTVDFAPAQTPTAKQTRARLLPTLPQLNTDISSKT